ncbi:MAG: hypothetical protein ACRD1G_01270, partial [Acidimicrobiales bacterium]
MTDIAVVFGGPSPEHDVSVLTGLQAARTLLSSPAYRTRALYWSKLGRFHEVDPGSEGEDFLDGVPRGAKPLELIVGPGAGFVGRGRFGGKRPPLREVLVNCCHGGPGEDGTLQSALDLAGVPYTGPDAAGAFVGMDKLAFGALVASAGLPTLPRALIEEEGYPGFDGPYIVKPRFGGSSIGIEVVEDLETAR